MTDLVIKTFKFFGLSVSRFDRKNYEERKVFFQDREIQLSLKDYTMIPFLVYLDNLALARQVSALEGDIVECGVWRGGMIAGISRVLGNARKYWLFDSFEGLPPAQHTDGEAALKWQANS